MLFDRFKKKNQQLKEKKSSDKLKERALKIEKKLKEKKEIVVPQLKQEKAQEAQEAKPKEKKEKPRTDHLILKAPQITEKAVDLQDKNQYVFKVDKGAVKTEIKKVVGSIYNVNVEKVRIVSIPAKKKRLGKTNGWQKGYKKAIVSIKQGQSIDIMPR